MQSHSGVATRPELRDLPPKPIVPLLADRGVYIASESSFYCVPPPEQGSARLANRPPERVVGAPNQVWVRPSRPCARACGDAFLYLYLAVDIYNRKTVGSRAEAKGSKEAAAEFVERACRVEQVRPWQAGAPGFELRGLGLTR